MYSYHSGNDQSSLHIMLRKRPEMRKRRHRSWSGAHHSMKCDAGGCGKGSKLMSTLQNHDKMTRRRSAQAHTCTQFVIGITLWDKCGQHDSARMTFQWQGGKGCCFWRKTLGSRRNDNTLTCRWSWGRRWLFLKYWCQKGSGGSQLRRQQRSMHDFPRGSERLHIVQVHSFTVVSVCIKATFVLT